MYPVEFVLNDYLQLRVDAPPNSTRTLVFNCYVRPRVERAGRTWYESGLGFADSPRKLTPGTVLSFAETSASGIDIAQHRIAHHSPCGSRSAR